MNLTPEQKAIIKADIASNPDLNAFPPNSDGAFAIADLYNLPAVPTFICWKNSVPKNEVGKAFISSALAAITSGNNDKLANFAAWNDFVDPSRADQRQFFDDIFSVAAGATTRAALLVLWKRPVTRIEKLLSTGTGTDAAPATLGAEGTISYQDIEAARA